MQDLDFERLALRPDMVYLNALEEESKNNQ